MRFSRSIVLILAAIFFCTSAFAQTQPPDSAADKDKKADADKSGDPEKDKKKKELDDKVQQMIEVAVADVISLKLPDNRAVVYGIAGDLYWKFDEKKARDFFRNAASEIVAFNLESDKEKRDSTDPYFEMFDSNDVRAQILPLVAKHDPDLALELLLLTRPAKLAEAIAKAAQPNAKSGVDFISFDPQSFRVQQEVALEQQFALLAADENPEKAIKLIKDSLAKGISYNVMQLLQKLNKKDEKKAGELAGEVVKKILDTDLTKKVDDMRTAISFLQYAVKPDPSAVPKEKPFKFTDAQVKDLANKIADTLLTPSKTTSMTMSMTMTQALPMLEKLLPEKAAQLKQRDAEMQSGMPAELKSMQQQQKLWDPSSTPEDIIAQLPKMQNEMEKASAYQSLSNKIGQIEDDARAKKLIDQIPDEKARANAQETYESARIGRSASAGKLDDARKQIGNLTKKATQVQKLVALAIQFYKKGGEKDIETARGLMKDARALTSDSPEDEDELNSLMEVVKGYAVVEPDTAFRIFEPIIDQINDFVIATAILSKYSKRNRTFRRGELVMKVNGASWDSLLLFRYMGQMQLLGKADLERMNIFSDRFTRPDARTIVKLFVIQGFLKDDKKPDEPMSSSNMIIFN